MKHVLLPISPGRSFDLSTGFVSLKNWTNRSRGSDSYLNNPSSPNLTSNHLSEHLLLTDGAGSSPNISRQELGPLHWFRILEELDEQVSGVSLLQMADHDGGLLVVADDHFTAILAPERKNELMNE
jgi:hypothetical protein